MMGANAQKIEQTGNDTQMTTKIGLDTSVLELLASRICHDLISPVGAVNNGVEFLQDMGADAGDEAISLIAYSASQAAAKLQAFRLAYGAGGRDPNIKAEDVHKTFADLLGEEGRTTQDWNPHAPLYDGDGDLPTGFCKILMGGLMMVLESLPRGGVIRVTKGDNGDVLVTGEGPDAGPRPNAPEALARTLPVDDLDPRLVHAYALSAIAAQYDFALTIGGTENSVTLRLRHNK